MDMSLEESFFPRIPTWDEQYNNLTDQFGFKVQSIRLCLSQFLSLRSVFYLPKCFRDVFPLIISKS